MFLVRRAFRYFKGLTILGLKGKYLERTIIRYMRYIKINIEIAFPSLILINNKMTTDSKSNIKKKSILINIF